MTATTGPAQCSACSTAAVRAAANAITALVVEAAVSWAQAGSRVPGACLRDACQGAINLHADVSLPKWSSHSLGTHPHCKVGCAAGTGSTRAARLCNTCPAQLQLRHDQLSLVSKPHVQLGSSRRGRCVLGTGWLSKSLGLVPGTPVRVHINRKVVNDCPNGAHIATHTL